jgi:hypothetical protein
VANQEKKRMIPSRSLRSAIAFGLLLAGGLSGGCAKQTVCDANQEHRDDGYCYTVDAAAGEAAKSETAESPWFQVCSNNGDCASPTTFCAIRPGQRGFCTAFGCDADPSICPAGAGCFDLASFGLAEHICIPGS